MASVKLPLHSQWEKCRIRLNYRHGIDVQWLDP